MRDMKGQDLSQILSQVPGVIRDVKEVRKNTNTHPTPLNFDLDQIFDFPLYYGDRQRGGHDARSRSDASSTPELTSGSSEEDGAHSPGPSVDAFRLKDAVKKVKQQDDCFTLPTREIRPKGGGVSYPLNIQLDNTLGHYGSSTQFPQDVIANNSRSPRSLDGAPLDSNTVPVKNTSRGKRSGPVANSDKIACVRKRGACARCRALKVPVSLRSH